MDAVMTIAIIIDPRARPSCERSRESFRGGHFIRTTSSAHTGGELRCLSRLPRGVPHIGERLHI